MCLFRLVSVSVSLATKVNVAIINVKTVTMARDVDSDVTVVVIRNVTSLRERVQAPVHLAGSAMTATKVRLRQTGSLIKKWGTPGLSGVMQTLT